LDTAVRVHPQLLQLLQQDMHDCATLDLSRRQLLALNPAG
jgi:flagellum-specific ATP synthase